jgi:hypothetical protein
VKELLLNVGSGGGGPAPAVGGGATGGAPAAAAEKEEEKKEEEKEESDDDMVCSLSLTCGNFYLTGCLPRASVFSINLLEPCRGRTLSRVQLYLYSFAYDTIGLSPAQAVTETPQKYLPDTRTCWVVLTCPSMCITAPKSRLLLEHWRMSRGDTFFSVFRMACYHRDFKNEQTWVLSNTLIQKVFGRVRPSQWSEVQDDNLTVLFVSSQVGGRLPPAYFGTTPINS